MSVSHPERCLAKGIAKRVIFQGHILNARNAREFSILKVLKGRAPDVSVLNLTISSIEWTSLDSYYN